jgi:hypothetical protein
MKIYIPSRGRYDAKYFTSYFSPIHWLSTDKLKGQTTYVVRDSEHRNYVHALRPFGIDVIPCGEPENLSQTRQWIAEYAASRGEKIFLMSDDDLRLFTRKSPEVINLREPEPDEVNNLIFDLIPRLLEDYAQVAISSRQGNNYTGGTKPYAGPSPLLRECRRATGIFAVRTDDYLSIDANRLSEMADFDTTLQLLRKGLKNAVIFYWAWFQKTQTPGGCAVYRTPATHEHVARQLKDHHPEYVSLIEKEYRKRQNVFGREFDNRTEVRIRWQKAYKSSKVETA